MGRIYIWICTNSPLPFPAFSQVSQPRGEVQKLYFTLDFDLVEDILDQGLGDPLGYIFSQDPVFLNIGGKIILILIHPTEKPAYQSIF